MVNVNVPPTWTICKIIELPLPKQPYPANITPGEHVDKSFLQPFIIEQDGFQRCPVVRPGSLVEHSTEHPRSLIKYFLITHLDIGGIIAVAWILHEEHQICLFTFTYFSVVHSKEDLNNGKDYICPIIVSGVYMSVKY